MAGHVCYNYCIENMAQTYSPTNYEEPPVLPLCVFVNSGFCISTSSPIPGCFMEGGSRSQSAHDVDTTKSAFPDSFLPFGIRKGVVVIVLQLPGLVSKSSPRVIFLIKPWTPRIGCGMKSLIRPIGMSHIREMGFSNDVADLPGKLRASHHFQASPLDEDTRFVGWAYKTTYPLR